MDNTREKLIELVRDALLIYGYESHPQRKPDEFIADHLIANGVTVQQKPQTNADRIRAMSDEELARFLAENEWECETYNDCAKCPRMTDDGCVSLLKWLKQPVEVEDGQA